MKSMSVLLSLILMLWASMASAAIVNGNFETGDFTGWKLSGIGEVVDGTAYLYSGSLVQELVGNPDEAPYGNILKFDYNWSPPTPWLYRGESATGDAYWGISGDLFHFDILGEAKFYGVPDDEKNPGGPYHTEAHVWNGPGWNTVYFFFPDLPWLDLQIEFYCSGVAQLMLDNVSIYWAKVPEASPMFLLGCGLIGLAGLRRKFKK